MYFKRELIISILRKVVDDSPKGCNGPRKLSHASCWVRTFKKSFHLLQKKLKIKIWPTIIVRLHFFCINCWIKRVVKKKWSSWKDSRRSPLRIVECRRSLPYVCCFLFSFVSRVRHQSYCCMSLLFTFHLYRVAVSMQSPAIMGGMKYYQLEWREVKLHFWLLFQHCVEVLRCYSWY